jgi:RNA recognition motif-containing protein
MHRGRQNMYSGGPKPLAPSKPSRAPLPDRANLSRNRVIQRDLVYVIGIPIDLATEENLSKYEYFGQYGEIKKIVVNNQTVHQNTYQRPTVSAYITFCKEDDAWECLYALESFSINGHTLKASFGTSKYCSAFLSGQKCNKPDCMYLHHTGEPKDSFSTEEIQQNTDRFVQMTRPLRPRDYDDYAFQETRTWVFPPRRILDEDEEGEIEEEAEDDLPEEVVEEKPEVTPPPPEHEEVRNSVLSSILNGGYLTVPPLVVDYVPGISLAKQFGLDQPSIRTFLKSKTR